MEYTQLYTPEEIEAAIVTSAASVFWFSSESCSVCKVLRPKVSVMLLHEFPACRLYYIDIEKSPLLSGQFRIFSIPTVVVYFEGKEFFRKSRNFSVDELAAAIRRPYDLMFSD